MPVPKYRTSASKRDMRRSHHSLTAPNGSVCPNCGEIKESHRACVSCGHYRGKQVMMPRATEATWDGQGLEPDAPLKGGETPPTT